MVHESIAGREGADGRLPVTAVTAGGARAVKWAVTLAIGIGLAVSFWLASRCAAHNAARLSLALEAAAREEADGLFTRLRGFERGIRGTRGAVLVGGQEHMSAETFRIYSESRDLQVEFPGEQGFGFIRREAAREVIQFIGPDAGNAGLRGLDIAAQPPLHAAAQAAIRSGQATITPPLRAVGASPWPMTGSLIVLPVYRPGMPHGTAAERDAAAIGWAFAIVDLARVAREVPVHEDVELVLRDAEASEGESVPLTLGSLHTPSVVSALQLDAGEFDGRTWRISARAGTAFAAERNPLSPTTVFVLGATLSLLLAALLAALSFRARRRREIHSEQALFASVVERASDAILLESPQGVVLRWNAAAERLFGYSAPEAMGRPLTELIIPAAQVAEEARLLAHCAERVPAGAYDTLRRHRDGSLIEVSLTASPVLGADGEFVAVAQVIRDIRRQKEGEAQHRRHLEERLAQQADARSVVERDLRAITDALPSIIAYWDRNLVNRFANRAHRKWSGPASDQMQDRHLDECFDAQTRAIMRPYLARVLRGETVIYERDVVDVESQGKTTFLVHLIPDVEAGECRGFYVLANDIGPMKEAERRYAESERFLEQAEAVSGVGGFRIDLRTGERTWTRQMFKVYEIEGGVVPPAEELARLLGTEARLKISEAVREAIESRTRYELEFPANTARGRPIWVRAVGVIQCEEGEPRWIFGAVQDITERKRADAALHAVSERSALAIEATGLGIWEWDLVSNVLRWDDQMYRLYGRTRSADEEPYALWANNLHVADRSQAEEAIQRAVRTGGKFDSEFRIRLPSGAIRHLKAVAKVQSDARGVAVRMVGMNQDISDLKDAERAMRASELKFRSLFELSPLGVAMTDHASGRLLEVNAALVESTGYSRSELLSMTYRGLTPERFHADEEAAAKLLRSGDRFGPYEKEYRRKDGSTYAVLLSGIRTEDASGRPVVWSIIQDISRRKAMESDLAEAARRDKLTGLANRALFMERLGQAVSRVAAGTQRHFAVLFLDFDRFKLVNDTLGHEAGDELLRQIADRLRTALRGSDFLGVEETHNLVSRFGGDEFLLLINDLQAPTDAVRIAERLLNTLAPAYDIRGSEVHSSASIGIVTSDRCPSSAEEVVRNADVAMYEAKRAGRACSVVYDEGMHTRLTRHVTIENSLRRAIGSGELYLEYQPIVDLLSGKMVSAEALIRWNHPTLGLISPGEFVPIAEESGLIVAVGQWVQEAACEAMAGWRKDHGADAPATVSVNVSRAELAVGERLLHQVRRMLEQHHLPAECLQLEVTEREFMRHPEAARSVLVALRELGVQIALDDFGTGTSSLGVLRHYPFNTIKIDGSFVKDVAANPDVLAVMHATIQLVGNLGMMSVAEGVEDTAQVAVLQSLGCRYAQGYVFSRPVSRDALPRPGAWQRSEARMPDRAEG